MLYDECKNEFARIRYIAYHKHISSLRGRTAGDEQFSLDFQLVSLTSVRGRGSPQCPSTSAGRNVKIENFPMMDKKTEAATHKASSATVRPPFGLKLKLAAEKKCEKRNVMMETRVCMYVQPTFKQRISTQQTHGYPTPIKIKKSTI